ncbi:MAG: hypothetical protein AAFX92_17680 [Pseudomonadota bacterium]
MSQSDRFLPDTDTVETINIDVTEQVTAKALADDPSESLPDMFATPFMIAGMERACAALLGPAIAEGQVSVGAKIDVSHLAPTPVGGHVKCHARFSDHQAPLYWFDVWAEDERRTIGKGRIARAILNTADLTARANS